MTTTADESFADWQSALERLGPDHPLLRPFQEAKRKQLTAEIDARRKKIRQQQLEIKDAKKRNLAYGVELFELQKRATKMQVRFAKFTCTGSGGYSEGLRRVHIRKAFEGLLFRRVVIPKGVYSDII